jgi:ATP-dependent DNA helicase RecG
MFRPLTEIKGVGPAKARALSRFGIKTVYDLLHFFPRRYIDRTRQDTSQWKVGETVTAWGVIVKTNTVWGKRKIFEAVVDTGETEIKLTFFRSITHFGRVLTKGMSGVFSGQLKLYGRKFQIVHPEFELLGPAEAPGPLLAAAGGEAGSQESGSDPDIDNLLHVGRIVPVYPGSDAANKAGVNSRFLRRAIHHALEVVDIPEWPNLPAESSSLGSRREVFRTIHFPEDDDSLEKARQRLIYEEFFLFHMMMRQKKLKSHNRSRQIQVDRSHWTLEPQGSDAFTIHLPFSLTGEQEKAIQSLLELSEHNWPFSALLQGDVGSGKTAVVLMVAQAYIRAGYQAAFLAPTEVLARQHYHKVIEYIDSPLPPVDLITGSAKQKARVEALGRLAAGTTKLVMGTHALLQEDVEFADLGLCIIDEQHRFGVKQRESLRSKARGSEPDLIAMTATPIPRTLAMSLYSNLDTIMLSEKPAGRQKIKTLWFTETRLDGIYNSVRKYVDQGQQVYIVYPLIEESEKVDLNACLKDYEQLSAHEFAGYTTGLLHGRLKSDEKNRVMSDFANGKIQILIATTVIEVGIDVPNATVMVIRNAERFGLSALHQLRGRVGRGSQASHCILVSGPAITDEGRQRLQAMVDSDDGFYLSDVDLRLRGPGEVLGLRQSGVPEFKIADFAKDSEVCREAMEDLTKLSPDKLDDPWKKEVTHRFRNYESIYT